MRVLHVHREPAQQPPVEGSSRREGIRVGSGGIVADSREAIGGVGCKGIRCDEWRESVREIPGETRALDDAKILTLHGGLAKVLEHANGNKRLHKTIAEGGVCGDARAVVAGLPT